MRAVPAGIRVRRNTMAEQSENKGTRSIVQAVVPAMIIALLVGGSAPWWWNKLFPVTATNTAPTVTATTATTTSSSQPAELVRVVIHLPRGNPRRLAEQVRSNLLKTGHDVPAITPVAPDRAPANFELRYFRNSERIRADQVVNELKASGVSANLIYRDEVELRAGAPLNQVELWFPRYRSN
jgi:hypothetical protein